MLHLKDLVVDYENKIAYAYRRKKNVPGMIEYKLVLTEDKDRSRSRLSDGKPMEAAVVYKEPSGFFDGEQAVFGRMWSREINNKTPASYNQLINGVIDFFNH